MERAEPVGGWPMVPPLSAADALSRFARVWLERLPLTGGPRPDGLLRLRSVTGLLDEEPARDAFAQLLRVEALMVALALESMPGVPAGRRVRTAELALTLLHGAGSLAETTPGAVEPFDLARACGHLAALDISDEWAPPHLPFVPPAQPADEVWAPVDDAVHDVTRAAVDLTADGVVAVLGTGRLTAIEEAIRATPGREAVTVFVATNDSEIASLVRLRLRDLAGCLRRAIGVSARLRLCAVASVRARTVAAVAGTPQVDDSTEAAVRVRGGRIVVRADGRGAGHAVANATVVGGVGREDV